MSKTTHVYANDLIVSFLYDRDECQPDGKPDSHRCDIILAEFSQSKTLWIIECKSKVSSSTAQKAIKQIDGCMEVIRNLHGWNINKCVIGKSYEHLAVKLLYKNDILHYEFEKPNQKQEIKNIINAVKNLSGYK